MSYGVILALLVSMATSSYAVGVGGQCDASANCITTNTQSYCHRMFTAGSCTKGDCTCNTGYTGSTCTAAVTYKLYGQSCTQNSDCGTGLTCTNSACACATSTYTYRSAITMCVDPTRKVYGEACTQSTQCYNVGGATTGMTCSTTCQCATGYIHRSGYCYIPYLGEACATATGCTAMTLPVTTDSSRQTETCNSGTCKCPSSADQYTISASGTSYSYCLTKTTATLKADAATCTLHNECASKICAVCPADATNTKRCLRVITSGVSGFQATTGVLLTLVALMVTLI